MARSLQLLERGRNFHRLEGRILPLSLIQRHQRILSPVQNEKCGRTRGQPSILDGKRRHCVSAIATFQPMWLRAADLRQRRLLSK